MKNNSRFLGLGLIFALVGGAVNVEAEPIVQSLSLVSGPDNAMTYVNVTGQGFGAKEQGPAVLYDFGEAAYENGLYNDHQDGFDESSRILRPSADPSSLWAKPSLPGPLLKAASARHSLSSRDYFFDTTNNFVGWPKAYGGMSTPQDNEKLYVSWWYNNTENQHQYYEFGYSNLAGSMTSGESVVVEGYPDIEAYVIGYDSQTVALRVVDDGGYGLNSSSWNHLRVSSETSSSTSLTIESDYKAGGFYLPHGGSNKFIRIWEESVGDQGVRLSWTQDQLTLAQENISSSLVSDIKTNLLASRWHHLEILVDLEANVVTRWVDSKVIDVFDVSSARRISGASPTIALLGFDGKQKFNTASGADIYMDSTPQRVMLANAATWGAVTHSELQILIEWSNNSIVFEPYLGSLDTSQPVYIYVADENGLISQTGTEYAELKSAPVAPQLRAIQVVP